MSWTIDMVTIVDAQRYEQIVDCDCKVKFATSMENRVLIKRVEGYWNVLISPEDPDIFIRELRQRIRSGP